MINATSDIGVDHTHARRPDLDVTIVARDSGLQSFQCKVATQLLDEQPGGAVEDWDTPTSTAHMVGVCMSDFTDPASDPLSRLLALTGAGLELWEKAPANFKEAYTQLAEADARIETIQITSDEPFIPWELMIPDDGDLRPLGVRHTMARWFVGKLPLRSTGVPAKNAGIAVPVNSPPPKPLAHGPEEAAMVRNALGGEDLRTTSAAVLGDELRAWTGNVLHFACHGTGGTTQQLRLDGKARLTARHVRGMTFLRDLWQTRAPVVFLNACQAGALAPSLQGAGGITKSWTTVGAAAVVAPLWSVKDEIGRDVAREFYMRIRDKPSPTYAEVVRDIRALATERKHDSYAAYCYYGSLWARAT